MSFRRGTRRDDSRYSFPISEGNSRYPYKALDIMRIPRKTISIKEAQEVGVALGVEFDEFDVEDFRKGMEVELEHTDVTGGDIFLTGKIVLAHLNESPTYYDDLEEIEKKYDKSKERRGSGIERIGGHMYKCKGCGKWVPIVKGERGYLCDKCGMETVA